MVYTEVKLVYTVRGRKLNRALIERAVSLSDEKYCSATAMFKKTAKVTHEVVLVEDRARLAGPQTSHPHESLSGRNEQSGKTLILIGIPA